MGDIEVDKCDFCREEKPINRIYLHGCEQTDKCDGFIIIRHCDDCKPKEIEALQKDLQIAQLALVQLTNKAEQYWDEKVALQKEVKELKDGIRRHCNEAVINHIINKH